MNKCIICGKEYKAKRSTSKYCGSVCRKLAFHKKAKNAKPGTVIPIQPGTVSEPEIRDDIAVIPQTAPSTQNPDEHADAQSTKSDEVMQKVAALDPSLKGKLDYSKVDAVLELAGLDRDEKAIVEEGKHRCALAHYFAYPDQYITRQEPERMNWGKWLNMDELRRAGFKCNRFPISGDWDYTGYVTPERSAVSKGKAQPATATPANAEVNA